MLLPPAVAGIGDEPDLVALFQIRTSLLQLRPEDRELGLRFRKRDAVLPLADHCHGSAAVHLEPVAGFSRQRNPEIGKLDEDRAAKVRLGNADDRRRLAVHGDRLSDDVVCAPEVVLPDVMREDHDEPRRAGLGLVGKEAAPLTRRTPSVSK